MNSSERFEQQAEQFYRDTGRLCPGKDVSAVRNQTEEGRQEDRVVWEAWLVANARYELLRSGLKHLLTRDCDIEAGAG